MSNATIDWKLKVFPWNVAFELYFVHNWSVWIVRIFHFKLQPFLFHCSVTDFHFNKPFELFQKGPEVLGWIQKRMKYSLNVAHVNSDLVGVMFFCAYS